MQNDVSNEIKNREPKKQKNFTFLKFNQIKIKSIQQQLQQVNNID